MLMFYFILLIKSNISYLHLMHKRLTHFFETELNFRSTIEKNGGLICQKYDAAIKNTKKKGKNI